MPPRVSDVLLRLAPLVTMGLVGTGLIANLAARHQPDQPALAIPTAALYLALALLSLPGRALAVRLRPVGAGAIAVFCALSLVDRGTGVLGGHLDAALQAAELGALGFNGHVSTKSLLFIGICALALLSSRQNRLLSTLFVLSLLAIINVEFVDLSMAGALWDSELSVWSTLCAVTLTFAATLELREHSVFSSLFLPGAAGRALRLMAGLSIVLPMAAGAIYAEVLSPTPEQADLIALLFGGLGWVMFQMIFLLGYIIAREMREIEALSRHDALTGLLNRAGLEAAVGALRAEVAGVMLCHLDGFGAACDALGRPRGDALLCDVAAAMRTAVADDGAILGRLWGDEFLILVPNLTQPHLARRAEALRWTIDALPPLQGETGAYAPRLSVGCAVFIPAEMGFDSLLNDADCALHWTRRVAREGPPANPVADPSADLPESPPVSAAAAGGLP